jgi:hypothetical protein
VAKKVESWGHSKCADCAKSHLRPDGGTEGRIKNNEAMKSVQKINMSQTALIVTVLRAYSAITRVAAGSQCFA